MTTPKTTKIKIIKRTDRKRLVLRFWDDDLGWIERTTGTGIRRDAARLADSIIEEFYRDREAKQRATLLAASNGGCTTPLDDSSNPLDWDVFRLRYEEEKLPKLQSPATFKSAANAFEEHCQPKRLLVTQPEPPAMPKPGDVSSAMFVTFEARLRKSHVKEATIGTYLKHLRACLGWARNEIKIIREVPTIKVPYAVKKDRKDMKGRPITKEEIGRLNDKFAEIVEPQNAANWIFASNLIQTTGLRLEETMSIDWDDPDSIHIERLDGRRPLMVFPEGSHKAQVYAEVPLIPEAVELLRSVPEDQRTGPVVSLRGSQRRYKTADAVGKVFCEAGRQAGIVVEKRARRARADDEERGIKAGQWLPKFASAHDIRRSFGDAMSYLVMPVVLMKLMRHQSIDTTMKYYIGRNTERLANEVWDAFAQKPVSSQGAGLGAKGAEADCAAEERSQPVMA